MESDNEETIAISLLLLAGCGSAQVATDEADLHNLNAPDVAAEPQIDYEQDPLEVIHTGWYEAALFAEEGGGLEDVPAKLTYIGEEAEREIEHASSMPLYFSFEQTDGEFWENQERTTQVEQLIFEQGEPVTVELLPASKGEKMPAGEYVILAHSSITNHSFTLSFTASLE
ncbi:hypothetical protein [Bacillus daqingensis]|uniref:hypothetical protein n=1 Tax=Bacillus daqingensis TaxID=872396 RepID=UPI0036724EE4